MYACESKVHAKIEILCCHISGSGGGQYWMTCRPWLFVDMTAKNMTCTMAPEWMMDIKYRVAPKKEGEKQEDKTVSIK